MKIINNNSVKSLFGAVLVLITITSVLALDPTTPAKAIPVAAVSHLLRTVTSAPPTAAADVTPTAFESSKPLLSKSLLESDPTRKLKKADFLDTIKYALYELTRGELEQIFTFVDTNKDDFVEAKEWDGFVGLFVQPFEACDKDHSNLLNEAEWTDCFEADPKSKLIEFRRRYQDHRHRLMMDIVSTRGRASINFSDYLFIRKALFGWMNCQSSAKFISKSHFKCAIGSALPQKYHLKQDYEAIYNSGLKLAADRNLVQLDFLSYLRAAYFTYVFGILNVSGDSSNLSRENWIKSIKEDRIPSNFEESEVNTIYELINNSPLMKTNAVATIDYSSWAFFYSLHRLFNQYSVSKPLQLSLEEVKKMLNDTFIPKEIVLAIDLSRTRFNVPIYLEASLILQKLKVNEKDFFNSRFKQDASETSAFSTKSTTRGANFYDVHANDISREVFFTTMADTDKGYWTKQNLFRAFQISNLYVEFTGFGTKSSVISTTNFVDKLPEFYDTVSPPINMIQRGNYVLYKALPREIGLDLLCFLQLENFSHKFQVQSMSSNTLVNENMVKLILRDYGMSLMPDNVFGSANKSYDSLHRKQFSPMEVARSTIIVQAAASENVRQADGVTASKVAVATGGRRFASSDKI